MMKNIITYIIISLLAVLTAISCKRDELIIGHCSCEDMAKIPLSVDYTPLGINPQNTTMLFYHKSDGSLAIEHRYENNSNEIEDYLHIGIGEYDVVVFNEMRNQVQNVMVRGHENLSTLQFYVKETDPLRTRSTEQIYIAEPGMLGVTIVEDFIVTRDMVDYTHGRPVSKAEAETKAASEKLLNIEVFPKISTMSITMHIKNLRYARMPALVDLRGIAGEYIPSTDKNSMTPFVSQFTMNNRVYDEGSTTDGTISTTIDLIGVLGERDSAADQPAGIPIELDILFMLVDKEKTEVNYKKDITQVIEFDSSIVGKIKFNIEITMPDPLPEVKPEGGDSGFGSDVEDWDKPIVVPL